MTKGKEAPTPPALRQMIDPDLMPLDSKAAKAWFDDLAKAAKDAGQSAQFKKLAADKRLAAFIAATLQLSPFIRRTVLDDTSRLFGILNAPPDEIAAKTCDLARSSWKDAETTLSMLRRCRADIALLVALADLGRVWDIDRQMTVLSDFADAALEAAASFALTEEHAAGRIHLKHPKAPQRDCGWIILAVGKLGAGELNYSSDIDLIALFEPDSPIVPDGEEPGKIFVRLTQALIRTLQEHTHDGYVLRTDLRLRPDPISTAIAVSVPAALLYYESLGQNWERAALIKARPVAGDIAAGTAFLDELTPFIWRRYLDYAAIDDIHSIKRQIHEHRGHATIAIAGHNLKLGRGGIREIEFFVQTQQLIAGGRNPKLRGRRTLEMLAGLASEGWVDDRTAADLAAAYRTLRTIEHHLQMIDDEQTHSLPSDPEELDRVAKLSRFDEVAEFEDSLRPVLETTQTHYAQLFEEAPALSSGIGNLVFTGDEDDPDTLQTLSKMGFADPSLVSGLVRGWHYGRYRATRSSTARERLTEVVPALLEAFGRKSGDPAVVAFDHLLSQMPAGLQLFSILGSNPALLSLFADLLGAAPRMAEIVTRRPHVLDAILEPAFFGGIPDRDVLANHLEQTMRQAASYEESLDRARIFGQEQAFLIGARLLAGTLDARNAGVAFTELADVLAAEALELAAKNVAEAHGQMDKGKVALIAMGKLGGREMTAGSDLDLILLYEFRRNAAASDGPRPISGGQYYARLTQRLVSALSAPTAEGTLYDVDFRLRPSGNAGPLATNIDAFVAYQTTEAWTWEHLALTRARLIAGDPRLVRTARSAISKILTKRRDPKELVKDILEMRELIEEEKKADGPWDIKLVRGGLIDIEFIAQYLQLRYAADHPEILSTETDVALGAAAGADLLTKAHIEILLPALRLYQALTQIIRLCVNEPFRPDDVPDGTKELLARAGELPDFTRLEAHLIETEEAVFAVFEELLSGKSKR